MFYDQEAKVFKRLSPGCIHRAVCVYQPFYLIQNSYTIKRVAISESPIDACRSGTRHFSDARNGGAFGPYSSSAFSVAAMSLTDVSRLQSSAPLIPSNLLFAEPDKDEGRLSPDGTLLLYLAPVEGKLGVWVRTLGNDDDRPIAHDPARPSHMARWQGNGKHVIYLQDRGGDENYDLLRVDFVGGAPERLTSSAGTRAFPLAIDALLPDEVLITLNQRKPSLMDVHRVYFPSGAMVLDTKNPGDVLLWLADNQLNVRAAIAKTADGGYVIHKRDDKDSEWTVLDENTFEERMPRLIAFSPENELLYAVTAKGSETNRLVQYELASGLCITLFDHPTFDVSPVYIDPGSREIGAIAVLEQKLVWTPLNPTMVMPLGA